MELPKRKRNRLKNYSYNSRGSYFITICTLNKNCSLGSVSVDGKNNTKIILSDYGELAERYIAYVNEYADVSVDNYVIMPNHIHLIITLADNGTFNVPKDGERQNETIPKMISVLKRFVNKEIGHDIWQRSYHDHVIRNEKEYEKINDYIKHNPETWADDIFNDNIIRSS